MFNMSAYSIDAAVTATLLIMFCMVELGLTSYLLWYYGNYGRSTFTYNVTNPNSAFNKTYYMYWLPKTTSIRSYVLQLATSCLGIIVGALILALTPRSKSLSFIGTGKRAPRRFGWPGISSVLALLFFLMVLPTLVVSFYDSDHYGSKSIPNMGVCLAEQSTATTCSNTVIPLAHPITIEGWTCKISGSLFHFGSSYIFISDNGRTVIPRTCTIALITRCWTIALLILPILIIILAFFEKRRKNIAKYNDAIQNPDPVLYPRDQQQSFSSATTATPLSPNSTGAGTIPPGYTESSELQDKQSVEMPGKQLMEAPEGNGYDEMPAQKHHVYSELSANRSGNVSEK